MDHSERKRSFRKMPTLAQLREQVSAPIKGPATSPHVRREMLIADVRGHRRPTDFVEQKLLAALQRPTCKLPEVDER
jgi:hypothetical protein